jgi:four helix bundle protein
MSQLENRELEERTEKFGESVILLCKTIKPNLINNPLISQIIRSATSIGANYMEANNASSRKDFANKIFICKKEAQETKHWLRMLSKSESDSKIIKELRDLWKECQELTMIFQKITNSLRSKIN